MKKLLSSILVLLVVLSLATTAFAVGSVTYEGSARDFILAPGSEYSPTDLFPNFKDVMPGDSIAQRITVKNDASDKVKVKIYMRALGAHEESAEFLSQLRLRVEKIENNTMAYMFDAAASETAQLTDWVLLGTLYSGGEVDLNVILDVPVELDNLFQQKVGYLDWEFMVEEHEIEPGDPEPPKTGDDANIWLWAALLAVSLLLMLVLLWVKKQAVKGKMA